MRIRILFLTLGLCALPSVFSVSLSSHSLPLSAHSLGALPRSSHGSHNSHNSHNSHSRSTALFALAASAGTTSTSSSSSSLLSSGPAAATDSTGGDSADAGGSVSKSGAEPEYEGASSGSKQEYFTDPHATAFPDNVPTDTPVFRPGTHITVPRSEVRPFTDDEVKWSSGPWSTLGPNGESPDPLSVTTAPVDESKLEPYERSDWKHDCDETTPYIRTTKSGRWETGIPTYGTNEDGECEYDTQEHATEADALTFAHAFTGSRKRFFMTPAEERDYRLKIMRGVGGNNPDSRLWNSVVDNQFGRTGTLQSMYDDGTIDQLVAEENERRAEKAIEKRLAKKKAKFNKNAYYYGGYQYNFLDRGPPGSGSAGSGSGSAEEGSQDGEVELGSGEDTNDNAAAFLEAFH